MKVLCYGIRDVERPIFLELNKKFNFELTLVPNYLKTEEDALLAKDHKCVILRGNCFANQKHLDIYKQLGVEYVLTRTVGVDHIDLKYARELGFKLGYVPGYSPNAISELALTLAMSLLRHTAYTCNKTSLKDFTVDANMFSKEVRNCTIGVIGLGRIGLTTCKLFKGLGAKVIGYDCFKKDGIDDIVEQVELDKLLSTSDIISLHCPYIKENGKLITSDSISKMKDGVILINTARGELVDKQAVLDALRSNKISGLALDVIEGESSYFFKNMKDVNLDDQIVEEFVKLYPQVLITPHIGSYTDEACMNMVETSFENLKEYLNTGTCKNDINK